MQYGRSGPEQQYTRVGLPSTTSTPASSACHRAVAIALVAGATSTIRLGSAGVQIGHRTPLSVVEEFGLINALYPGRLDLGIGRSIGRPAPRPMTTRMSANSYRRAAAQLRAKAGGGAHTSDEHADNGLLLPKRFDFTKLIGSPKLGLTLSLLQQPNAYTPDYEEQIATSWRSCGDVPFGRRPGGTRLPGRGRRRRSVDSGRLGGESAAVAGSHGLRFAASYHHSPSTVLDAVDAYRAAFRPSEDLARPYISVSADVVVGRRRRNGHGGWRRDTGCGCAAFAPVREPLPFPTPEVAAAHEWSDEDRALVKDRIDTQLVGSPQTVADKLEQLQRATGADELAMTTITHRHADRVRSYELLAQEWRRRQN